MRDFLFWGLISSFFFSSNNLSSPDYLITKNVEIASRVKLNSAIGDNIISKMPLKISRIPPILPKKSKILNTSLLDLFSNTSAVNLNSKRILELSIQGISVSIIYPGVEKIVSSEFPKIFQ